MKRAYLFYERQDATINAQFIAQLQTEARILGIELVLHFPDELYTLPTDIAFVWNRSRQHTIAEHFEQSDIRVFNNSQTNTIANDKQLAQQFVATLGFQTIENWERVADVTHYPVVLKSVDGHGGAEVFLCPCEDELIAQLLLFENKRFIIQPFIESNAQDVRVWMLGNEVLGAVLRTGTTSFKSNYTLGGTIEKFALPPTLLAAATSIANALQSDYIGIDFIRGTDGTFYFNELEDPVGAKSYYDLYDDQLAKRLITYIHQTIMH